MTDTKKIIEEQINQAWARGTNWAMQGRGYALDTDADTQAEVLIELFRKIHEEARVEGAIEERERKTVYQCSCCGFRSDGILRIHDCKWTNQLKIGYLTKKD